MNLETAKKILSELNWSFETLMDGSTCIIYNGISYRIAANNKYLYIQKNALFARKYKYLITDLL